MANIGGNITAVIQAKTATGRKNEMGEAVTAWNTLKSDILGWLSYQSGDSKKITYNAKIEETTHVFLTDYSKELYTLNDDNEKAEKRMIIKGVVYDILLIDNPDEMDEQLEIYLKKVGAWNGEK